MRFGRSFKDKFILVIERVQKFSSVLDRKYEKSGIICFFSVNLVLFVILILIEMAAGVSLFEYNDLKTCFVSCYLVWWFLSDNF